MSGRDEQNKSLAQYGGQAIIEGVMMRSPHYFAVACRKPDGAIVVKCEEIAKTALHKLRWLNKPFLRGTFALLDAMILGGKALNFASNVQLEAIQGETDISKSASYESNGTGGLNGNGTGKTAMAEETKPTKSGGRINDIAVGGTIVLSLAISLFIFRIVPTMLTDYGQHLGVITTKSKTALNGIDGLIRVTFFFTYLLLISQLNGIKRVFQYHGAEHKAINTLEAGLPLNSVNAQNASRIHPRCGTSFIVVVLAIDVLICLLLPRPALHWRILLHLAVLPFVAGLSYEVIKAAGKYRHSRLVMAIFAPGMWSQYLTTREPDPDQTEVSLAALYAVLHAEGRTDLVPETTSNPDEPAAVLV